MLLRLAICDDVQTVCSMLEEMAFSAAKALSVTIDTEVFYSGRELANALRQGNHYDLIFLDIEMDEISGIDVSDILRSELDDIDTELVYVTCTTQYDRALFRYHPLAFVPKPPKQDQIHRALSLALKKRHIRNPYFSFSAHHQTHTIPCHKILYIESEDRKLNIVTGSMTYSCYGKLSDALTSLPPFFCRIHRAYIVNLHQIAQYGSREILMKNGQRISVGRSYRDAFLACQLSEAEGEGAPCE